MLAWTLPQLFHYTQKTTKEDWWPFFTESPEEKESLSYKKGHFETRRVAQTSTINTAPLAAEGEDFSDKSHQSHISP